MKTRGCFSKMASLSVLAALGCFVASAASIEHIALEIEDPASMVKWWTENLGFRVTLARPTGSTFIEDESGRVAFELYAPSEGRKEKAEDRMEIDFLIAKSKIGRRHNISPIEVKSGKNYTLNSLNKFRAKYRMQTNAPHVIHSGDFYVRDGVTYLPLYMTPLL